MSSSKFDNAREQAEDGEFAVYITNENTDEIIGVLGDEKTFNNEVDASMAANDAAIPSVGIEAHVIEASKVDEL